MTFQDTAPTPGISLGRGEFSINTEIIPIARMISKTNIQAHSDILRQKLEAHTKAGKALPDGDVVAVFEKAVKTGPGNCLVTFQYFVV